MSGARSVALSPHSSLGATLTHESRTVAGKRSWADWLSLQRISGPSSRPRASARVSLFLTDPILTWYPVGVTYSTEGEIAPSHIAHRAALAPLSQHSQRSGFEKPGQSRALREVLVSAWGN